MRYAADRGVFNGKAHHESLAVNGAMNHLLPNYAFQPMPLALRARGSLGPAALGAAERGRWAPKSG